MGANKRILCIGDSLGLPRKDESYIHTWYYKISQFYKEFEFIPRFMRAMTTENLTSINPLDSLENFEPNIVILQVGIVDCSPRLLPKDFFFTKLIGILPKYFSSPIWRVIKKITIRRVRFADVSPFNFKKNLYDYFSRCNKLGIEKLVFIKISKPGTNMIIKNKHIVSQVELYNNLIDKVSKQFAFVELINPLEDGLDDYYISDGYHLNKNGHNQIFLKIKEVLSDSKVL